MGDSRKSAQADASKKVGKRRINPAASVTVSAPDPPPGQAMTRLNGEFGEPVSTEASEAPVELASGIDSLSSLWIDDGGSIALVGAGPGDPGLLTVRAWRLLQTADVVLYDSLTSSAIVESLKGAECIDVGKRSKPRTTQDQIHELMLDRARRGDAVVRLKGGDPVVFGRGGEEAEFLTDEEIPFQIVPGITSVVAAPELVGIPLTHREISSSFTVITGHEAAKKDESNIEWDALADRVDAGETLVVVMGVNRLNEYVSQLLERGVSPGVSVAMIEKITWDEQQTVTGTLDDIVELARETSITPPATTIIGGVVDVSERVDVPRLDTDNAR